jgi:hypothetical protein
VSTTIFRIEPGVPRQVHRLCGDVVNRDQMVGDELHPTVIAECAEIGALFGEIGERQYRSSTGRVLNK